MEIWRKQGTPLKRGRDSTTVQFDRGCFPSRILYEARRSQHRAGRWNLQHHISYHTSRRSALVTCQSAMSTYAKDTEVRTGRSLRLLNEDISPARSTMVALQWQYSSLFVLPFAGGRCCYCCASNFLVVLFSGRMTPQLARQPLALCPRKRSSQRPGSQ